MTVSKELPRTSQPSPAAFSHAYEQAAADGSEAVVLTVAAALLDRYVNESGSLFPHDAPRTIIGSVIGTHAGPGAVAAAFFKKQ